MLGYQPVIIERSNKLGGLQNKSPYLNNWIAGIQDLKGIDIAANIHNHIEKMQIPVIYNNTINKLTPIDDGYTIELNHQKLDAKFIVIATGVKPRKDSFTEAHNTLIGPGNNIKNFSFENKRVAILGGGDSAAENYAFIKERSNAVCHVYARTLRARKSLVKLIDEKDLFSGSYSANQNTMQVYYEKNLRHYDIFIVLYGWEANIPPAFESFKSKIIKNGFVYTDSDRLTGLPNILAIGEVTARQHPCVITSMADGVAAAKTIQNIIESYSI